MLIGSLFIKSYIYEPNFLIGKSNKILSVFIKNIYCGFKESRFSTENVKFAGIPLKTSYHLTIKDSAKKMLGVYNGLTLCCLGGSQGSSFLNRLFLELISKMSIFKMFFLTLNTATENILILVLTAMRRCSLWQSALWKMKVHLS